MADINTLIAELRAGLDAEMDWRKSQADFGQLARFIHAASPQNIRALLDHIERLKYDLDLAKEQSLLNYNDATGLAMKLGTAEAELARLRKPVTEGEVKGVVRSLSLIACAPRCEHASECNCTVLDNAADLIQRLAGQMAEAQSRFEREHSYGFVQNQLYAAAAVRAWTEVSVPRDDAIGVVAALAATISIIERTPQARKAAMSDKAFGMMLADYTKALAKGRAMLSASGGNRD